MRYNICLNIDLEGKIMRMNLLPQLDEKLQTWHTLLYKSFLLN